MSQFLIFYPPGFTFVVDTVKNNSDLAQELLAALSRGESLCIPLDLPWKFFLKDKDEVFVLINPRLTNASWDSSGSPIDDIIKWRDKILADTGRPT